MGRCEVTQNTPVKRALKHEPDLPDERNESEAPGPNTVKAFMFTMDSGVV